MASFGWKRKAGEKVSKSAVQQFEEEEEEKQVEDGAGGSRGDGAVDWLCAVKRRREALLEACAAKSRRLKDEGAVLAEQGRHRDAVKKWDEAIQLTPDDPGLYEMKSQVLTILQDAFPAVKAAETAVKFRPLWWEGWQTLGRAQLDLGEVDLAVRSFQVAVHLCPAERALWQEDLTWAWRLQRQRSAAEERARREEEEEEEAAAGGRRADEAPELGGDYDDFESDEVLAACVAAAERQARRAAPRRTAVVVDAEGNVRDAASEAEGPGDGTAAAAGEPSAERFVKARGP